MLVPLKLILERADRGGYAVPAFNFHNLETLQAIIEAAEKMRSPVILAITESTITYCGMEYMHYLVAAAKIASRAGIPMALHLDHGKNLNVIKEAINVGYTSVMFDGSSLSFEENIKTTWRIVQWAHTKGISVEAELGSLRGVEGTISVSAHNAFFTDPRQAEEFVIKTGCDALAIAVGTSHGAYKFKGTPQLDFERIKEIDRLVRIPLVLHGSSSLPSHLLKFAKKSGLKVPGAKGVADKLIKKAITLGIRKINIDTDLRLAFTATVRQILKKDPSLFDPRKILVPTRECMCKIAIEKIKLFKSANKA
ncbi:MAG: class II fructose-1,6-bisphosphate aldolase [bacterium]|nr:class II fructose-1,6-bisphosphate aldolase [bacterium]